MWYKYDYFNANDWLCFKICNQTGSRAVVINDIKVFIEKVPEL
jgi:hypothetical protein